MTLRRKYNHQRIFSPSQTPKYCSIPATGHTVQSQPSLTPAFFQQYCAQLQPWEHQLLLNVEFLVDQEDIDDILQEDTSLYLVTDGGAVDGAGYFGWVIATDLELL
eukprot:14117060-Ditylum_brightwellii.AAC.1